MVGWWGLRVCLGGGWAVAGRWLGGVMVELVGLVVELVVELMVDGGGDNPGADGGMNGEDSARDDGDSGRGGEWML